MPDERERRSAERPAPSLESDVCNFDGVIRRLRGAGVEFIVFGGQAEVLMGSPRITYDIDICYRRTPENLSRLVEALKPLNPWPRNAPRDVPFIFDELTLRAGTNFTFDTSEGKVDLLGYVEPLGEFGEVQRGQEIVDYAGQPMAIIGLDDSE
jgi:hypothetical protein